jgi:hypothetical protein
MIRQLFEPPVEAHLGVDEVRVDRRQLDGQAGVQRLNDLFVSFHDLFLVAIPPPGFRTGRNQVSHAPIVNHKPAAKERSLFGDIET